MKVYVDELPEKCKDCKFQCFGECLNGADILNCDYSSMKCHLKRGKVKDCPLQSISDYTKQVRKKAIAEVRDLLEKKVPNGLYLSRAVLKKELDELQGVEDGTINN